MLKEILHYKFYQININIANPDYYEFQHVWNISLLQENNQMLYTIQAVVEF